MLRAVSSCGVIVLCEELWVNHLDIGVDSVGKCTTCSAGSTQGYGHLPYKR